MPHRYLSLSTIAASLLWPMSVLAAAQGDEPPTPPALEATAIESEQAAEVSFPLIEEPPQEGLSSPPAPAEENDLKELTSQKGLPASSYQLVVNESVSSFLTVFQSTQKREIVERWLSRSGRYLSMIRETFRQKGLPEELAYTAMIESGFDPVAVSRAGAKGLWQFMEGTARRYGLTVDRWVDERLDPEKSTHAAAMYFKDLFNQFGSWFLAQAAYNAGELKVAKAIQRSGSRDFWQLTQTQHLLDETKRFVPAIVAATMIAKEPDRYGFRVAYQKPEPVDVATVPVSLALKTIAQWTGTTVEKLRALNPELRWGITPPTGNYAVKLPAGNRQRFEVALLRAQPRDGFTIHKVNRGQSVAQVARLYKTTPQEIQALNNLSGYSLVKAGTELVVPLQMARAPQQTTGKQGRAVASKAIRSTPALYIVRAGDTLGAIALRHQVSAEEIAKWNGLAVNATIYPGDSLRVAPHPQSGS